MTESQTIETSGTMQQAELIEPQVKTRELTFEERLCAYMIEKGRLTQEDLLRGERIHKETLSTSLVPLLVRVGLASERDVAASLSEMMELDIIKEKDYPETVNVETEFPLRFMTKNLFLPIDEDEETIKLIMVYPSDEFTIKSIKMASQKKLDIKIGLPSEVENAIEKFYGGGRSAMGQIVDGLSDESAGDEEDVDHLRDLASEAPVIRLVNIILQRAVEARASDIHVEPFENRLKVRYRIDGVLQEVESPPARSTAAV
ncbi:MAG TPA: type II secretion system protein GspE, partial [Oceanospirillales bacterium]|nr:type II secretion system protein GspE [Oceanospirillales bacterium]